MRVPIFFLVVSSTFGIFGLPTKEWNWNKAKATCGYATCPTLDQNRLNVHIVPHSHDDVGWLKTVDQYYYGRRTDIQRAGVQYIIDSVVTALDQNPERRFIQVETAFFHKWWKKQTPEKQELVKRLVNSGQLEITGGGWSMNDEAAVHYQSTIDQFTLGLRVLNETLGECGRPRIGWQIDPFGHSREMASTLARMGYDGLFFSRLDWRDKSTRLESKTAEMIWKGSASLGDESNIFTSVLYNHYSAPRGFCFDVLCSDDPIIDDLKSPDYNYERKVVDFASFIRQQAQYYTTNNIIITMGDDFNYQDALSYFKNLDLLIKGFKLFPQKNDDGKIIEVFYSTPSCYLKAANDFAQAQGVTFPVKTDDFFPYASDYHAYWSGYYSSRPTSKRFERTGNNLLQVATQIAAFSSTPNSNGKMVALKEAMGIMQHHDAITGTEKQHVADDYARILTEAVQGASELTSQDLLKLMRKGESLQLNLNSCLLANMTICDESKGSSFVVTIYNPLSRVVSEYVRVPVNSVNFIIRGGPGLNEVIPNQVTPSIGDFSYTNKSTLAYELVFQAKDIPPLGAKLFHIEAIQTSSKTLKPDVCAGRLVLGNNVAGITINDNTGLVESLTLNSKTLSVHQELLYYIGAVGDNGAFDRRASGAYIFRPSPESPEALPFAKPVPVTVYKGELFDEVHQEFSDWAKQVIRVYSNADHIEFEWLVGPIPINDGKGKEVISRFTTNIDSQDLFYTDSNGREIIERKRNFRPTYNYTNEEPIAGNYHPVTSKILIKGNVQDMEFAVLNDRAQGGTSLTSGQVELMVHRRCLRDDAFGVGESLNEMEFERGLVARGMHFVTFGNISPKEGVTSAAIQRDIAQRKILQPWVFVADASNLKLEEISANMNMEVSFLRRSLPKNVQILTLDSWDIEKNQILIRLEHVFEKGEDPLMSGDVTVELSDAFTLFNVLGLQEMTLDANQLLEETNRLQWNVQSAKHPTKKSSKSTSVMISPMQIRTFIADVQFL